VFSPVWTAGAARVQPCQVFTLRLAGGLRLGYSPSMDHPRISQNPAVMGGKPCVKGTRIPVEILLKYLASGDTVDQVLEGYPSITREDVLAAIAYAADFVAQDGIVPA
jgi:uncharacterized protein (DUF433 family)